MPVTGDLKQARFLKKEKSVTLPRKRGAKPNPFSVAARARKLGVSKQHLHFVLRGERTSLSLLRRYRELVQAEGVQ